jgi:integrase/recombinase XerD
MKKLTFNKKLLPLATISPREANRVKAFLKFIGESDITQDSLVSYLYARRKDGIASKTLKADKSAIYLCLKLYCVTNPELRPLFDQIRIVTNEAIKLRVSTTRIRESDLVTLEEMKLIQREATDRAKTLCLFLWTTGIRPGEIGRIKLKDCQAIDKDLIEIKILGKQERIRYILIPTYLYKEIQTHYNGKTFLFESIDGYKLSVNAIEKMIYKIGKTILNRRVYPYLFRHTFATMQIKDGSDIGAVAEFMGNSADILAKVYLHSKLKPQSILNQYNLGAYGN